MHAHPLEARIAHLEGAFDQVNIRLGSFEQQMASRFDQVDRRFDQVDRRIEQVDRRIDQVDRRIDQTNRRFDWGLGILVSTWVMTMLAILFHH